MHTLLKGKYGIDKTRETVLRCLNTMVKYGYAKRRKDNANVAYWSRGENVLLEEVLIADYEKTVIEQYSEWPEYITTFQDKDITLYGVPPYILKTCSSEQLQGVLGKIRTATTQLGKMFDEAAQNYAKQEISSKIKPLDICVAKAYFHVWFPATLRTILNTLLGKFDGGEIEETEVEKRKKWFEVGDSTLLLNPDFELVELIKNMGFESEGTKKEILEDLREYSIDREVFTRLLKVLIQRLTMKPLVVAGVPSMVDLVIDPVLVEDYRERVEALNLPLSNNLEKALMEKKRKMLKEWAD